MALATLAFASGEDLEGPQIVEFDFWPKTISEFSSTITVRARVTDDLSGLKGGNIYFRNQGQLVTFFLWPSTRISGDALDGVYQGPHPFSPFAARGTWHVTSMTLYDEVGNHRDVSETELIALGFPTELEFVDLYDLYMAYVPLVLD